MQKILRGMLVSAMAIGVGFSWGDGVLTYKGKKYTFSVDGLQAGAVGASAASAAGEVYGLKKLEDFNGTFSAVTAGATVGGGGSVSALKNENGVSMHLRATSQGLKLTTAVSGVKVELKK